jgi:hypothetical protein
MYNPSTIKPAVYFHLLIYGVFKNAVSISKYILLSDRNINEYWTERVWKEAILFYFI